MRPYPRRVSRENKRASRECVAISGERVSRVSRAPIVSREYRERVSRDYRKRVGNVGHDRRVALLASERHVTSRMCRTCEDMASEKIRFFSDFLIVPSFLSTFFLSICFVPLCVRARVGVFLFLLADVVTHGEPARCLKNCL